MKPYAGFVRCHKCHCPVDANADVCQYCHSPVEDPVVKRRETHWMPILVLGGMGVGLWLGDQLFGTETLKSLAAMVHGGSFR